MVLSNSILSRDVPRQPCAANGEAEISLEEADVCRVQSSRVSEFESHYMQKDFVPVGCQTMRLLLRLCYLPEMQTPRYEVLSVGMSLLALANRYMCVAIGMYLLLDPSDAILVTVSFLPLGFFIHGSSAVIMRGSVLNRLVADTEKSDLHALVRRINKSSQQACVAGFARNCLWQILIWLTMPRYFDKVDADWHSTVCAVFLLDILIGRANDHAEEFQNMLVTETVQIMTDHVHHFKQVVDGSLYKSCLQHQQDCENSFVSEKQGSAEILWQELHTCEAKLRFYMDLINSKVGVAFGLLLLKDCYFSAICCIWLVYFSRKGQPLGCLWFGAIALISIFLMFKRGRELACPADSFYKSVRDLDTPLTMWRLVAILGSGADTYMAHLARTEYGVLLWGQLVTTPRIVGCFAAVILTLLAVVLEGILA
mmetsp:Transcript_97840/g.187684  ORF Transcript_97840/g.187684 Transcript_97840/m.187684 type:complete len:425 (+) Transcript_97840:33-1307(+)